MKIDVGVDVASPLVPAFAFNTLRKDVKENKKTIGSLLKSLKDFGGFNRPLRMSADPYGLMESNAL